ncbi:MAG: hypothetical protein IT168_30210 [Bryobacterales bacterium]|nr:hypothetical protein [Bryobacterales bacterium]
MTRRTFAAVLGGSAAAAAFHQSAGWTLVFEEVHDNLEVRVGGKTGKLVKWAERGADKITWTKADCTAHANEPRSLDKWVTPDEPVLTLWARVTKESGGARCKMKIVRKGQVKATWEFDKTKAGDIDG